MVTVEEGGPADQADLQEGDIILEIDHKPVRTLEDYHSQIKKVKKGEAIPLLVKRRNGFLALNITK